MSDRDMVFLDGEPVYSVVAFNVKEGWVDVLGAPDYEAGRHTVERRYGNVGVLLSGPVSSRDPFASRPSDSMGEPPK